LPDPEADADPPPEGQAEGLFHRVVRSVIAPDVLEDGGRDAPMSRRGRIAFYSIITILVVGIAVLLVVTASSR
jgi:hypothetical protein